ncbi:PhlD [Streptomyces sp. MS1.AVA.3]|uniref:thiolase family protein n=1 Tax=Streptomyces decoyicus TaxID=249567 RepID=UPI0030C6366E
MTNAHVSRPVVVPAPHKVTTDEVIANIRRHHPTHEKIRTIPRHITRSGVRTRNFSHPIDSPYVGGSAVIGARTKQAADMAEAAARQLLGEHGLTPEEVDVLITYGGGSADIGARTKQAYSDAVDMAEAAARQLLDEHDLAPEEVDVLITSNSVSGGKLPGVDIPLAERLGLRPNIRRIPLSTVACAGGATAIARAADMLAARPQDNVLCVVTEPLSTTYHHADTDVSHMIFKGLFGDAAAAFLATSAPIGPGVRIEDTLEFRLPESSNAYFTRPDASAVHFDSSKASLTAVKQCLPELQSWMAGWHTDIPVIHTGSPDIINSVAHALDLDERAARHAHASLAELGNVGGCAVLDVLARVHTDPPKPGDKVAIVSFGPGFVMVVCRGVWCS